jgi:LmbE family N-acetylglucosaminyl deacetylase
MAPFISPHLATTPQIVARHSVERGEGRTLLLVVAHADDPAFFMGGVLPLWADCGWKIVCLRVTDDRWDSVALGEDETVRRNSEEFRVAAQHLGIAEIHELGWQTDVLGDASRVKLRERIIHTIRRFKPYGLVSFDPFAMFLEDNLDHKVLADAVDEATWTAKFDKHHPEHFAEGLEPHGIIDRWYFGRSVVSVTHVFDTSSTLERQLAAILSHTTMLQNMTYQFALQARTSGIVSDLVNAALVGDHRPLFETLLAQAAAMKGEPFGLKAAETLRLYRAVLPQARQTLHSIVS